MFAMDPKKVVDSGLLGLQLLMWAGMVFWWRIMRSCYR